MNIKKNQKSNDTWIQKLSIYNENMDTLFDIYCTDDNARKQKETRFGIKMADGEATFLENMRTSRTGYCLEQVDRKWERTMQRKLRQEMHLHQERMNESESRSVSGVEYEKSFEDIDQDVVEPEENDDNHYSDIAMEAEDDIAGPSSSKKNRREFTNEVPIEQTLEDTLPSEYRHLRSNARVLKPEFYRVIDKLMSVYHCPYSQALAGIIETGNILFSRNWKYSDQSDIIDLDTAPMNKALRTASKAILWQTLAEIVEEMMRGSDVIVTYHEDGSKKKGCGSFCVQGCMIDGKYRAFPTLPIASESRENLAVLKRTVLDILSCVNGGKYSSKEIFERITFRVSDAVSHNLNVDDLVALDLGTDHIPDHLLCHAHPVLMFNRKVIDTFSSIENTIGSEKIFSKLLVEVTNTHDSVTEQYIHCIVNLFSPEFNHKNWNQSSDFAMHIAPQQNMAVGFPTERFNRFVYLCAVLLHHDNHVWSFLRKYEQVTNNLACIVRSFEDVDFLRIHCAVGALVGLHLVEPYLSLTTSTNVPYSKLTTAMQQLYTDLTTTKPDDLLDLSQPAFLFTSKERFEFCVKSWDESIIQSIQIFVKIHKERIVKVLHLVLPKLAKGFHLQRGHVFGFGTFDPESKLLVTTKDPSQLDRAPINNLASERHVGAVNYGLAIHGANQLNIVSSAIVKSKAIDLIELKPIDEFQKYRCLSKKDGKLLHILRNWENKQEQLKKDGLKTKEIQNIGVDTRKNKDLAYLKEHGGPFTSPEEVDLLVQSNVDEKTKEKRLYTEVRYARDTSLSLPKSSALFRLKEKYKNLPTFTYQQNLKTYLSKIHCNIDVTWTDFDEALGKLSQT